VICANELTAKLLVLLSKEMRRKSFTSIKIALKWTPTAISI